jgi:Kae1-associated kinase Bud32
MHFPIECSLGDALKVENNIEKDELTNQVMDFCKHIAGSANIASIAYVDNYSFKTQSQRAIKEVMLVVQNYQPRMMSYLKPINSRTVFVFVVDQWIFERDIERGFLGEAVASKLIFPYAPIKGKGYLRKKEVELKKRLVIELLENLALNFPELANCIKIKPQYFLYEVFLNRIRVFPLLAYDLAGLMGCLERNEKQELNGYNEALFQLEAEKKVILSDGYISISEEFISSIQTPKRRIINLSKNVPRTLFTSIFGVLPQLMSILSQNIETFLKTQRINWVRQIGDECKFIDPQKYVYIPTGEGLISLSDRIDIKSFIEKMLLKGQDGDILVEPVGGMLNDVYLINTHLNGLEYKVLAKRFKDWAGFKWFPLSLWSFGARSFALSGQARLSKEYAISETLRAEGFNVPRILHVSNAERLVFMEYIEGDNLSQTIKRIAEAESEEDFLTELALIDRVGEIFAQVHSLNITLGDTKPENMLIKEDGTIFLIDFEQATHGGDKAWDIAVFLYYCGHYLQPLNSSGKAESIAKNFIAGYLRAGGKAEYIHKASTAKYTRVFSIFTMPPIMLAISNVCKRIQL